MGRSVRPRAWDRRAAAPVVASCSTRRWWSRPTTSAWRAWPGRSCSLAGPLPRAKRRPGRSSGTAGRPGGARLRALPPQPMAEWVVWARGANPPPRVKEPIDWVLLTSLPVRDLEGAMEVIGSYEKRWLIEEWHKALKTGCQVEGRQLHTSSRLEA